MNVSTMKTHPLILIAATAVILTCLLAIAIMTGILPSPGARNGAAPADTAVVSKRAPGPPAPAADSRLTSKAPADSRLSSRLPPATGTTQSTAPSSTVAGSAPAVCNHCGTVTSVRAVKQQGEASMVGPIAGGAIGGLLGHQVGSGSGNKIATIAGAAGGAAIGTEVERRAKATTHYVVNVRLNDGTTRSFNYGAAPGVSEGDKVKVVDGRLVHGS